MAGKGATLWSFRLLNGRRHQPIFPRFQQLYQILNVQSLAVTPRP